MSTALFDYYEANKERHLEGLLQLLRIPSISTLPEHKPDIQRAAEFLANEFREMGMKNVEIIAGKEGQHPLVYAEWLEAPGKPTAAYLRPLRRATRRSAGRMDLAAFRAHHPQQQHLCARRGG